MSDSDLCPCPVADAAPIETLPSPGREFLGKSGTCFAHVLTSNTISYANFGCSSGDTDWDEVARTTDALAIRPASHMVSAQLFLRMFETYTTLVKIDGSE